MKRYSKSMLAMLQRIKDCRDPWADAQGRAEHAGASQTLHGLHNHGLVTSTMLNSTTGATLHALTAKGRAVLKEQGK